MEPTTIEAAGIVSKGVNNGGAWAIVGAVAMKIIDKIPWIKLIGGTPKSPLHKGDMELAIAKHQIDCRKCTDKRFEDTIQELKESRAQEAELRKLDIDGGGNLKIITPALITIYVTVDDSLVSNTIWFDKDGDEAPNGDYCKITNQNDVDMGVYTRIRLNRITQ